MSRDDRAGGARTGDGQRRTARRPGAWSTRRRIREAVRVDRGPTLFRWFHEATGADEDTIRERVYFAAVARCFPGKAPGGGDRRPAPDEIDNCRGYLREEVAILRPTLVIPVGTMAIAEVLGHTGRLTEVIGTTARANVFGTQMDAIALPHPSGASTWHRTEPGIGLLADALRLIADHPSMRRALQ